MNLIQRMHWRSPIETTRDKLGPIIVIECNEIIISVTSRNQYQRAMQMLPFINANWNYVCLKR